jgi:3-phosphoshikimate 1-carboxyvinyltransferase
MSLDGTFSPPGDKSISHRIVLLSLLARGTCRVANLSPGGDVRSSLDAVSLLGARVEWSGQEVTISGAAGRVAKEAQIDCGNSGTTMRLLMGILAGIPGRFLLDGDSSLRRRPMERVAIPLRRMGATVDCTDGRCPLTVEGGGLKGIDYELPVPSAQLKSAVLLAGLQAEGTTVVRETTPSRDHTERLLEYCGGRIFRTHAREQFKNEDGPRAASKPADGERKGMSPVWSVERSSLELPLEFRVPSDVSSAAFFLCAAAIIPGSRVRAEGVLLNPTRTGFLDVLRRMGARTEIFIEEESPELRGTIEIRYSPNLSGCEISGEEIPALVDEVPILALVATQARGRTVFLDAGELRLKESDRLAAVADQLSLMGARVEADSDCLTVEGPTSLKSPPQLDSYGDHRMAMTLRLAGLLDDAEPYIEGEESSAISYPEFQETLRALTK